MPSRLSYGVTSTRRDTGRVLASRTATPVPRLRPITTTSGCSACTLSNRPASTSSAMDCSVGWPVLPPLAAVVQHHDLAVGERGDERREAARHVLAVAAEIEHRARPGMRAHGQLQQRVAARERGGRPRGPGGAAAAGNTGGGAARRTCRRRCRRSRARRRRGSRKAFESRRRSLGRAMPRRGIGRTSPGFCLRTRAGRRRADARARRMVRRNIAGAARTRRDIMRPRHVRARSSRWTS